MFALVYPHHSTRADQLAYLTTVAYWGVLEAGLCVISACLPTFSPLFSKGDGATGGLGSFLAYRMERGWAILTGQSLPLQNDASSYSKQDDKANTSSDRNKGSIGKASVSTFWKRNASQGSGTATEGLIDQSSRGQAYMLNSLKPQDEFAQSSYLTQARGKEVANGRIAVSQDVYVKKDLINGQAH